MENRITGVMIYYYFVCKRKLWYFCHEIRMEAENEDVILGKILDESSYSKNEKHINITTIQSCADFFLENYLKTFYLFITHNGTFFLYR